MEAFAKGVGAISGIADWAIPVVSLGMGFIFFYWWLIVPPILSGVIFITMSIINFSEEREGFSELTPPEKRKIFSAFLGGFVQAGFNTFLINGVFFGIGAVISLGFGQ